MIKGLRRKGFARVLKRQAAMMKYALDDPRTPRAAKVLGAAFMAYLLSPVDLIPDFIPVVGQLDDIVLVPAGFFLVWRMIPREVWRDARERAERNG
jgi:uncharacterized membrane protein YkvA (DUF1232 family)